jgi:hypothetical protein
MSNIFSDLNINDIIKIHPEELKKVICSSSSVTDILRNLGLQPTNNRARSRVLDFAANNGLDLPVYVSQKAINSKEYLSSREEALKFLVKGDISRGTKIRKIVLKYSLLNYFCEGEECQLVDEMWGTKKVEYQLDHINGDNTDNRLENLRFLCIMCHSFTETYGGKNAKNKKKNKQKSKCLSCFKVFEGNFYCANCHSYQKDFYTMYPPSLEVILSEVRQSSIYWVSKKYFLNRAVLRKIVTSPELYYEYPRKISSRNIPSYSFMVAEISKKGLEHVASIIRTDSETLASIMSEGENLKGVGGNV